MTEGPGAPASTRPLGVAKRSWALVAVGVFAMAAGGFLTGIERPQSVMKSAVGGGASADIPAPGYRDLREVRRGPNANMYDGAIASLGSALPSSRDPVAPSSPEALQRVLDDRKKLRAYDGAPPMIPHPVAGDATTECLACHGDGAIVEGKIARAMSHARFESCTQCHAQPSGIRAETPPPLADSTFQGAPSPAKGQRAWEGAPPTIPHATWMRERCESCHGVAGAHPMRSSHPERASCTQCHAPSAELDQRTARP